MAKLICNIPFFQAPNNIFDDNGLSLHDITVYLYLCRCGNNAKAFPSYATIAKRCRMSRAKAITCITTLIDAGYVIKRTRQSYNANYSNVYEVVFKG